MSNTHQAAKTAVIANTERLLAMCTLGPPLQGPKTLDEALFDAIYQPFESSDADTWWMDKYVERAVANVKDLLRIPHTDHT
jgi:hypothetical protein